MIQEIITYIIIGSAVTVAIMKIIQKFSKKKIRKNVGSKNDTITEQHNCSSCSAECILRGMSQSTFEANPDLCKKVDLNSDRF
jgi:hypothetical protein